MTEQSDGIPVLDGPHEGVRLGYTEAAPASVLLTGDGVPEGFVARYRYDPKRNGYVFKGFDQVVAMIPIPGSD